MARAAGGWPLLCRLKEDLRLLSPELLGVVRGWFDAVAGWDTRFAAVDLSDGAVACEPPLRMLPVRARPPCFPSPPPTLPRRDTALALARWT